MRNLYDNVWEHNGVKFRAVPYSIGIDQPCTQCPFVNGKKCGSGDFDCLALFYGKDLIRMSDKEVDDELTAKGIANRITEMENKEKSMLSKEQREEFEALAKPLIKFINDNANPHTTVIITSTDAEVCMGVCAFRTDEFIKG